jgi:hypothetical protein
MRQATLHACRAGFPCVLLTLFGCGSSSSGPASSPIAHADIGPIPVGANVEKTVCITKDLGNTEDLVISGYEATLDPGSHHLIVYATKATQENLTPTKCTPFVGLATGDAVPLLLVNKLHLSWAFPPGVGVQVHAHQMLRLEAHYINTSAKDIMGLGSVEFHGAPKSSAPPFTPADFFFWGTQDIHIPPRSRFTAGPNFQAGDANMHVISISTHQHELGTGVQVWASAHPGDMSNRITDDTDWSNPSWKLLSPPIDMNGTNGLTYQCDWNNTTQSTVTFGESALDEMCFVGGYYYPGHGFQLHVQGGMAQSATPESADAGVAPPDGAPASD